MTDARVPDRWLTDPEFDQLSDRAFRTFIGGLQWSNGQGTDGRLPASSLRFLHPLGVDDTTAAELITAEHWTRTDDGYQVAHWTDTQSLAADVNKAREDNKRRQAEWRKRHSKSEPDQPATDSVTGDVTGDVTRYVTGDVTRESLRLGKAQAQAQLEVEPKYYGTSPLESETDRVARLIAIVRNTGCVECQRRSAFPNAEPCPEHRAVSA